MVRAMERRERTDRRVGGFTLVELLVVVAVIALLIAVLLPALSGARRSAMGLVSLSRMRQVATGWAMYAYDADDTCVPGQPGRFGDDDLNVYNVGNGPHYRPRWFAAMGAKAGFFAYYVPSEIRDDEHTYQVNNEVFLCPVVPEWTSTRNHPYGYNYQFLGNARFAGDDESEGFINYPVKSSMLRTFSETVMFASCLGTAGGKPESARTPNLADGSRSPGLTALGGHGYALDPPRIAPGGDYADRRNRSPQHRSAPDARYQGRVHVAWCDGSARAVRVEELGYQVREDGSFAADDPEATNRFFSGTGRDEYAPTVDGTLPGR
jgi:prepilin-type N-terminal cleavage/methylation domain-containing protein/prepilin-type processing-associated H-X9-DG protein